MRNGNLSWHLMLFRANAEQKQVIWLFCSCYHNTRRYDIFILLNDIKMLAGMSAEPGLNVILRGKHHIGSTVYYKHTQTLTHIHAEQRMQWNTCTKQLSLQDKKNMFVKFNLAYYHFFMANYIYFKLYLCKPLTAFLSLLLF